MNTMVKLREMLALALAFAMFSACLTGCSQGEKEKTTAAGVQTEAPKESSLEGAGTTGETDSKQTGSPETESGTAAEEGTRTVVDAAGQEVQVPSHPKAIAMQPTVLPNMVYALQGTAENIIAVTPSAYKGYEISIMKDLAPEMEDCDTTIFAEDINMESLAAAEPDLVLLWTDDDANAQKLRDLGIPVVMLKSATDMESLRSLILMLGNVLNCESRAEEILAWYDEVEEYINSKSAEVEALADEDKPRVIHFQYAEKLQIYANGVNPYITDWVGGKNIELSGASADTSTPTMEEILAYDPEIVFLSNFDEVTPEDLYENRLAGQDWSNVSAVKNHRVYKVPCGLYRWAPPNTIEKPLYILWLAQTIQPEVFPEVDIRTETRDFFQDFFSYQLTEEQLDSILHTDLNQ